MRVITAQIVLKWDTFFETYVFLDLCLCLFKKNYCNDSIYPECLQLGFLLESDSECWFLNNSAVSSKRFSTNIIIFSNEKNIL